MEYFKSGFELLKKNLNLYLISLILSIFILFLTAISFGLFHSQSIFAKLLDLIIGIPFLLLLILDLLFSISFSFSIPKFLDSKPKNLKEIINISFQSLGRLILWIILYFTIIIVFLIIYVLLSKNKTSNFADILNLISTIFTPLFIFWSMFFSIEKNGFIQSISKSIKFSLKNLKFVYLIFPYYLLSSLIRILIKKQLT